EVVHQAAEMCRKRGRIVLVGVVGLGLNRSDFYAKELSFQVACSYGPARYQVEGRTYRLPFVRWTAARNFAAVLDAIASGRLAVCPLIARRLPVGDAAAAYEAGLPGPAALGRVVLSSP